MADSSAKSLRILRPDDWHLHVRDGAQLASVLPFTARQFARATFLSDNRADLPRLNTRTLVLQCREDIIAPPCVGEYVHAQVPNSTYVLLDATGHCPNLSAPDKVTAAIRAFV